MLDSVILFVSNIFLNFFRKARLYYFFIELGHQNYTDISLCMKYLLEAFHRLLVSQTDEEKKASKLWMIQPQKQLSLLLT